LIIFVAFVKLNPEGSGKVKILSPYELKEFRYLGAKIAPFIFIYNRYYKGGGQNPWFDPSLVVNL